MSPESMAFTQKKRVKNGKNKYLKPGALARLRYSRASTKSCTDIGKKRVALDSEKKKLEILNQARTPAASPNRTDFYPLAGLVDGTKQQKLPGTPKTPVAPQAVDCERQSRLESLPTDLLVKILCHLHHDQLRPVFHVSQRIQTAVLLARQFHFNYTTPDRSRQEMLRTKARLPNEHWPFISKGYGNSILLSSPHTPKAPRHGPRPPRPHLMDMKQISAVLFQEPTLPSRCMVPPGLPRPIMKPVASNRVLFYESELFQAVAQNKLG